MKNYREAYKLETRKLLMELKSSLLELEKNPTNMELIGDIFRALHTIKGSGAMFGFDSIAEFTHEVEKVFDLVREVEISVTKRLICLTLSACNQIRKMVDNDLPNENEVKDLVTSFKSLISDYQESDIPPANPTY